MVLLLTRVLSLYYSFLLLCSWTSFIKRVPCALLHHRTTDPPCQSHTTPLLPIRQADNDRYFYFLYGFAFSTLCTWNHTVYSLSESLLYLEKCISASSTFIVVAHGLTPHLFLLMNNIPLYRCTTVCLPTHLVENLLAAFKFWQLWIKLL